MTFNVGTSIQYTQSTPSANWVILHGFGRYPIVDVYIDLSGTLTRILPKSITFDNPSQCTVAFNTPQSGFATVS